MFVCHVSLREPVVDVMLHQATALCDEIVAALCCESIMVSFVVCVELTDIPRRLCTCVFVNLHHGT